MNELNPETLSWLKQWLERSVTAAWSYHMDLIVLEADETKILGRMNNPADLTGVVDLVNIAPALIETAMKYRKLSYEHDLLKNEVGCLRRAVDGGKHALTVLREDVAAREKELTEKRHLVESLRTSIDQRDRLYVLRKDVEAAKQESASREKRLCEATILIENAENDSVRRKIWLNGTCQGSFSKDAARSPYDALNNALAEIKRLQGIIAEECTAHKATRDRAEGLKQRIVELGKAAEKV